MGTTTTSLNMMMNAIRLYRRYDFRVNDDTLDLLCFERPLLERGEVVVGIDEVGRGALAGPLTVGAVVITSDALPPEGLADSKLLSPKRREELEEPLREWCAEWSLGTASPFEIDEWGLRLALAVAATRALAGLALTPTIALLDGPLNLLSAPTRAFDGSLESPPLDYASLAHITIIKGDSLSATVAAASVLAKVHRDRTMTDLAEEYPTYGWAANKGYGAPHHLQALLDVGPCQYHRLSWRPFAMSDPSDEDGVPLSAS
jgi:ribonuclease HII